MDAKQITDHADRRFPLWGYRRGKVVGGDGLTPNVEYIRSVFPGSYLIPSERRDDWKKIRDDAKAIYFRSGGDVLKVMRI